MTQNDLNDKDLNELLAEIDSVEKLMKTNNFKVFKKTLDAIADRAIQEFVFNTKADNLRRVVELQTLIKLCKYNMFEHITNLLKNQEFYENEAYSRGPGFFEKDT